MSMTLLIHGGPILTMDERQPIAEAIALQNGDVLSVGSERDVRDAIVGDYDDIALHGRLATPGLIDAHAHVVMVGMEQREVDATADTVSSISEIGAKIRAATVGRPEGTWIKANGYDQASLAEQRHPNRHDLDAAAPDHPVLLMRSCHHIAAVNSRALALAGIDQNTPDPDGGTIDRDEHGEPTGVLRENAVGLVEDVMGEPGQNEIEAAIIAGGRAFAEAGVTGMHEAGIRRAEQMRAFQSVYQRGELPIRINLMMIIEETLDELIGLGIRTGLGDEWLRIGNAKLFTDGSIGGRTARMRQPYRDQPHNYGIWMEPPEVMKEKIIRAHAAGFQVGCHAIGDAAITLLLDSYEEAQRRFPRPDTRHRIEHCSIVDLAMVDRIAQLGVVPIPGTSFLYYTRPAYVENVGVERIRYAYAMKTFHEKGIVAAASTDAPVVPVDPLIGIQTMVTRRDRNGDPAWPEEAVSVEEALRAYTVNAAYAAHEERRKGRLKAGMAGDVTIFSADLRDVPADELTNQHADMTIIGGEVVAERAWAAR